MLSDASCWLLLTRLKDQAPANQLVEVTESLHPDDAAQLFDQFTMGKVQGGVRKRALRLLDGHPLALTWAANLLAYEEEDPEVLVGEWEQGKLPALRDPMKAKHTLEWLYERSVRVLDADGRMALDAAGLLAHAPFPAEALLAVLLHTGQADAQGRETIKVLVRLNLLRVEPGDRRQFTHVLGYQFAREEAASDDGVRQRRAAWLDAQIRSSIQAAESASTDAALSHLRALLRADSGHTLWRPLVEDSQYDFQDRLVELGRLGQAKLILEGVTEWLGSLPPKKTDEPYWKREKSVSWERTGNVLRAQGDLAGSLALYRESLELLRRLAASDAANVDWQRDVSVICNKVGDVLLAQGDVPGALALYRESLELRRLLAASDASNADRQRDVSVSCNKVGDVLLAQGDSSGALALYRESLELARQLASSDALNAGWQRDVSVSCNKVGGVLLAQGDTSGAQEMYEEDLELARRLAASDASNAGWQRDVSVSCDQVGDVLLVQGNVSEALALYQESLVLRRRLAASDASNAGWQRDLSVSLNKMAQLHEKHGHRLEALSPAEESLAIGERLASLDPSNVTWQKDVAISRRLVARLRG